MKPHEFRAHLENLAARPQALTQDEKASLWFVWVNLKPQTDPRYHAIIEARLRGLGVMR